VTERSFDAVKVFPRYTAPATAVSLNDSQVSAEVSGVIASISVKPGDEVSAGDVLVKLDCRDHQLDAQVPEARLEAANAERDLARYRSQRADALRKKGAMPLEQYQQRKAAASRSQAEVRRLQAVVKESRRKVGKCDITAPFPAVVVTRYASVGELAKPGMRLLRLVDTRAIEVSSQVQEQDLGTLRAADSTRFVSRSFTYPVNLRTVVPVLDRRVSSYEVRLEFSGRLPSPGQSGRLEWRATQPHIPADLLVQRNGTLGVFLAKDGHARFHALPGAEPGQPAAADLAGGAQVIVDGRHGLDDGQAIDQVER